MNEIKINALKLRELLQLISDISDSEIHMVITKITSNSLEAYANSSEFHQNLTWSISDREISLSWKA